MKGNVHLKKFLQTSPVSVCTIMRLCCLATVGNPLISDKLSAPANHTNATRFHCCGWLTLHVSKRSHLDEVATRFCGEW